MHTESTAVFEMIPRLMMPVGNGGVLTIQHERVPLQGRRGAQSHAYPQLMEQVVVGLEPSEGVFQSLFIKRPVVPGAPPPFSHLPKIEAQLIQQGRRVEHHPPRLGDGRGIHQPSAQQHLAEPRLLYRAPPAAIRESLEPLEHAFFQGRLYQVIRLQPFIRQNAVALSPPQGGHHGLLIAHHHRPRFGGLRHGPSLPNQDAFSGSRPQLSSPLGGPKNFQFLSVC